MTKPKPANPALSISHPDLASALAQIGAEVDHQPLRSSALGRSWIAGKLGPGPEHHEFGSSSLPSLPQVRCPKSR